MFKRLKLALLLSLLFTLMQANISCAVDSNDKYITAAKTCVDNLIKYGRDSYGTVQSPIFVSILDVNSRTCPEDPLPLEEKWRVIRRERRNPAGANLLLDQALLKTMFTLSEITGDKTYANEANSCIEYYLKNLVDKKGFIWWGWHRHYDVYKDIMTGHEANWHEVQANLNILWPQLWSINSKAVISEVNSTWHWQVIDKEKGEINRHDDGCHGCDFTLTAGNIIEGFAFMYTKTNDPNWLNRAKLVANYYWNLRDPKTNLIPERPNAGKDRFDGSTFLTNTTGPYCHALLKTYLLTKDNMFKQQAVTFLAAYNKYAYDYKTGKYWGALKMDGSYIPGPRVIGGYEEAEPRGYLDLWEPYVLGYQYPIETAQSYALAFELTKDQDMLTAAKRFADWIAKTPTDTNETDVAWYNEYKRDYGKYGTYADKYGRTISFFIDMYALTNQQQYLQTAQKFADESIAKLYVNGLFKGHPAKPYYESTDGVGNLLYALVELDQALKGKLQGFDRDNW
ncbi:MAG TPA: hypothetical protein DCP47_01260 [Phycisphaerales bacterium]|nr:hypothetical protein [Phycisphaerales bacterium]